MLLPLSDQQDFAGLVIPHTNLMQDELELEAEGFDDFQTYHVAVDGVEDVFGDLASLNVMCWAGEAEDRDEAVEDGAYIEGDMDIDVDDDRPFGVYGELSFDESYSCEWYYETSEDEILDDVGTVMPIGQNIDEDVERTHIENIDGFTTDHYNDIGDFEIQTGWMDLEKIE